MPWMIALVDSIASPMMDIFVWSLAFGLWALVLHETELILLIQIALCLLPSAFKVLFWQLLNLPLANGRHARQICL